MVVSGVKVEGAISQNTQFIWGIVIWIKIQLENMAGSITIEDVYQELKTIERKMVTHEDLEALIDSVEILSNPETMEALRKSDLDIKEGRVKKVSSLEDLLSEL